MAFPTAPTIGDDYTTPQNVTYTYTADGAWKIKDTATLPAMWKGNNNSGSAVGTSPGEIFRIHEQTLSVDVTIAAAENALAAGPITLAAGVSLTVNGNLSIV